MDLKSNEKINNNISDISKKYEEILLWINSIDSSLCKNVKNVEDLKDGNIFIDLLKYYFQQNKQRHYEGLLNSAIRNKSSIEKMKIIFKIFLQLTNNNEINSRLHFFQNDINKFLRTNELLMELVLYIKYLYKKNIYNGNKLYNNKEKDLKKNFNKNNSFYNYKHKKLSKNNIKDFYDYNKYKRIIINNFINNNNDNKVDNIENNKQYNNFPNNNINIEKNFKFIKKNENSKNIIKRNNEINTYIYKPKSFTKNIISNFYDFNNKSITPHYKNNYITNKFNEDLKIYNKKNVINLTDKNNESKDENEMKKIFIMGEDNNRKDLLINLDKTNNICRSSSIQTNNENYNNYQNQKIIKKNSIFGIFINDKIDSFEGYDEFPIYKIFNLTNPIILNKAIFEKSNPKLNINKELFNIKKDSIDKNSEQYSSISNNFNNNLKNQEIPLQNKKIEYCSFLEKDNKNNNELKENYSKINNLIESVDPFEKKIKRHNSYLLGMNKLNNNNINNVRKDIKSLSNFNLHNNIINSNMKNFSDKNLFHDNSKIIINNNDIKKKVKNNKQINKNDIYNWLLDFNIINKGEVSIISLPQIVSDGIILIDIINRFTEKSNQIKEKEIFRNITSKEEALININKALDYLKNIDDFPKRHVLDNELIFEIDDKAIWELLYDLYKYYSRKIKKVKNENNNILKKLNYITDLNKNRKEFWSRNNRGPSFEITDLYSHNQNNSNKIYNKKLNSNNNEILNSNKIQKTFNPNYLAKSYNPNYYVNNNRYNNNDNINKNINFENIVNYHKNNNDNNNNYDNKINNQNNIIKNEPFSFALKRNLSDNYENSKLNNKGYFDYVNELKKQFDQNKINKISKNNEYFDKNESNFNQNSKNIQLSLNFKENLHFNYNENLYDKKNSNDYSLNNKYNNTENNDRKANL